MPTHNSNKKSEKKSDEQLVREISEFDGNYLNIDKDRLVLFAVNHLLAQEIEPTFDKIVAATFKLFPKVFSLIGFPEYPDGRTIYYCVYNHCTLTKKWLRGNVQSGFRITDRGKYLLDETNKMLAGKIKTSKAHSVVPRRKEITFIESLKQTDAYKKFKKGQVDIINRSEIYDALRVPPHAVDLFIKHYNKFLEYAIRVDDSSAIKFLEYVKIREGKNAKGTQDRSW